LSQLNQQAGDRRERGERELRGDGGRERGQAYPFLSELSIKVPDIGFISLRRRNEFRSVSSSDNAIKVQNCQEIGLL
jgi:hypothetical protein